MHSDMHQNPRLRGPKLPGTSSHCVTVLALTSTLFLPLEAVLEGTPTRYSNVRATAEGEGRPFR